MLLGGNMKLLGRQEIERIRGKHGELRRELLDDAATKFWNDLGSWYTEFGMRSAFELECFMLGPSESFKGFYRIQLMHKNMDLLALEIDRYLKAKEKAENAVGAKIIYYDPNAGVQ